jgi:hypothetical protein
VLARVAAIDPPAELVLALSPALVEARSLVAPVPAFDELSVMPEVSLLSADMPAASALDPISLGGSLQADVRHAMKALSTRAR